LGALSDEEIRAMEGQERRHLEARISVLRDIQTLLDAAVLQMNQYGVLVARLEQESTNNNIPSRSSANEEVPAPTSSSAASTLPQAEVVEASPAVASVAPEDQLEVLTPEEETNLSDQERLRRRRLQRFMNGEGQN